MFLIRSGSLEGFEQLVVRLGGNPAQLLATVGFTPAQLLKPDSYISYQKMAELLEISARACAEPLFGLKLAERQGNLTIGELGVSATQEPNVGAALNYVIEHVHLHARGVNLQLTTGRVSAEVRLTLQFSTQYGIDQLMQLSCGLIYNTLSFPMSEQKRSITIALMQTQPEDYRRSDTAHYHSNISFGDQFNGVYFPLDWIATPIVADADQLRDHFHRYIENLERRYPNNLEDQVRHIIGGLLPSSECNLQQVGHALNLHERVLQKRLANLGTSYGKLLRATRLSMASELLRHSHLSVTEIALNLGYADVSIFSRNFKSWTGRSPRAFLKLEANESANSIP